MAVAKAIREAKSTLARLRAAHPEAHCELEHRNAFQLIVATVLSAQTTDVNVNKATPALFARWPDATSLAKANPPDVEKIIQSLGFFRMKAKSIIGLAKGLVERHGGDVPQSLDELVKLPGVGRKTANVVLGVAFSAPEGVVVDTHVQRISQRLGWTRHTEPVEIEQDLMRLFPREEWDAIGHTLIFHGRRICTARKPACAACAVNDACPSAFKAELVGRKKGRERPAPTAPATKKASVAKTKATPKKRLAKVAAKAVKTPRAAKPARARV
ncbi:MAG TPA: endonuclease III [Polyangiaceae bacterium]|jgi:endonuclease-3|nr:endonuclease III [Polyangiaceae bacterium]